MLGTESRLELVEIAGHVGTTIACVYIRGDRFTSEIGVAEAALTKPPDVIKQTPDGTSKHSREIDPQLHRKFL